MLFPMLGSTRFVERDGATIAYRIAGSGPLIVFLHGIGGNKSNWAEQFVALAGNYCCVAVDARGYGESRLPVRPLVFGDFADDLATLLDHLQADRAHFVGLSMGGFVAQDFAHRHADRVSTLTLAGSGLGTGPMSEENKRTFLALRLDPLDAGASMADIARGLIGVLTGRRADTVVRARLRNSVAAVPPETYRQALRAILTTDFATTTPAIHTPTLVIVGEDDKVLPIAESSRLTAEIAGSRMVVIPRAGHLCNIEAPEAFDAALFDFLSGQVPARATIIQD